MPTGLLFGEHSNDTAIVSLSTNPRLYYDTNRPIRAPCVRSNAPIGRQSPSLPLGEFELELTGLLLLQLHMSCTTGPWTHVLTFTVTSHPTFQMAARGGARRADLTHRRDADTEGVKRPVLLSLLFTADIFRAQSVCTGVVFSTPGDELQKRQGLTLDVKMNRLQFTIKTLNTAEKSTGSA